MRPWRGLPRRVFLAVALCAGLAVAVTTVVQTRIYLAMSLQRIAVLLPKHDEYERVACERDPANYRRRARLRGFSREFLDGPEYRCGQESRHGGWS